MAEEVKSKPSFVDELLWGLRLKPLPTEKELTASKPVVSTKPKDVKISPSLTDELLYGLRLKNLPTDEELVESIMPKEVKLSPKKKGPSFMDEMLWSLRLKPLPTEEEPIKTPEVVSKSTAHYNAGRGSLDTQTNTYRIPFENYTLYAPSAQKHIDTINKVQQGKLTNEELLDTYPNMLPEVVATPQPNTSSLGGGIYEYLVNKGAQSLASFAARKKLAEKWGINNYTGTAEQNALLQRMFEHQFALAEMSNNTQGLRKGIDY